MARTIGIGPALAEHLRCVERFEASPSRTGTPTGTRVDGQNFENDILAMWTEFGRSACDKGAKREVIEAGKRFYARLRCNDRDLWIPSFRETPSIDCETRWLEVAFRAEDLVSEYPGTSDAIDRYAPSSGPFVDERYPCMYKKLKTTFDDTVLLTENGVLIEKILLEYKTAKSTNNQQIDGNAHERLSFQIMQYLEAATRYTRCSLVVIANGAYIKYRNKYHVNFNVQADRLKNFSWFKMEFACTSAEYARFLESLLAWLFNGSKRKWC